MGPAVGELRPVEVEHVVQVRGLGLREACCFDLLWREGEGRVERGRVLCRGWSLRDGCYRGQESGWEEVHHEDNGIFYTDLAHF